MPGEHRAAILVSGAEGYGVATMWRTLITGLEKRGVRVVAVSIGPGQFADMLAAWGTPTRILAPAQIPTLAGRAWGNLARTPLLVWRQTRSAHIAGELLRSEGAATLLFQNPQLMGLAGLAAKQAGARPVWLVPNTVSSAYPLDLNRRLYAWMIRRYGVTILANSEHTRASLGRAGAGAEVVRLGVDVDCNPLGRIDRGMIGAAKDDIVFGIFARMVEEKGQLLFLKSLLKAAPNFMGIRLVLCGGPTTGEAADAIRRFASAEGVSARVHMVGHQTDLRDWYALCDVIVNARIDPEPFGLTIVEAMHFGKPVLAHRLGGPEEIVIDGETGWLMDAPTETSFTAAILQAIADRARWDRMGAAGRDLALRSFSADRMVEEIATKSGIVWTEPPR